ncbi:MAG TPA: peroxidase-related enzyme [Chthoniobacterales bacterium]
MSRIKIPTRDEAPVETHPALDGFLKQLGFIPNLFLVIAQSPNTLNGILELRKSLSKTLDSKLRARIALAVSQVNECEYCLAAHTYVSKHFQKLPAEEVALNRAGHSSDPKADAAVHFAKSVTETRGKVTDEELAAIRRAGFTDAQIIEIVASAVQFLFTNFINNVAETDVDFAVAK